MNGLLIIDKPGGLTSRAAVNRVQKWFPRKTKIGHTGTLDPLATGVLVICIGAATRLADYVQAMSKSYTSRFRLGATSTTDDANGVLSANPVACIPTREQIERELASFIGTIEQVPPAVSALKVSGQRAHELVRRGNDVQLAARPVRIDTIRVTGYTWPHLDVDVDCGKGTYIRSIARDLGAKLGCGGIVETLRRTRIGPFTADQGIGVDAEPEPLRLLPLISAVAGMPQLMIDSDNERRLRSGQSLPFSEAVSASAKEKQIAVLNEKEELIGIAERTQDRILPFIVLNL